ncbi:hypothetical protein MNV49_001202 [Pseudohyphozyma bogoriensis]|nr:hypothetical protein MNV49_001202 [Pseudohyphozyma bogoriensis]
MASRRTPSSSPREWPLPYPPTLEIIFQSRDIYDDDPSAGGRRVSWETNESAAPLARICRAWEAPATLVLWRSVVVLGMERAEGFLEAVRRHPERAEMVQALVVGLGTEMEDDVQGMLGQEEVSRRLVEVMEACPNLLHLQVRPLHRAVLPRLLAAIRRKEWLRSLVLAPRLAVTGGEPWDTHGNLAEREVVRPTLTALELDVPLYPHRPGPRTPCQPFAAPIPLEVLALRGEVPQDLVRELLKAGGKTLRIVDIYLERAVEVDGMAEAMRELEVVEEVRVLSNPTFEELGRWREVKPPLWDRLLPQFTRAKSLETSATEISSTALRLLPATLESMRVQSFNPRSVFRLDEEMRRVLEDESVDWGLREVTVLDTWDAWGGVEGVREVRRRWEKKGVRWEFVPDKVESGSDE